MSARKLIWWVLMGLCVVVAQPSRAQSNVVLTNSWQSHDWAIAPDQCYPDTICYGRFRVDQNNVLYTIRDFVLYVYPANGYEVREYEIPRQPFLGGGASDWEPLGNGYVAFYSLNEDQRNLSAYSFKLYNMATEELVELFFPIQFIDCYSLPYPIGRSFMRLGTGSDVIACSYDGENGYGLHVIDLVNQSVVHSVYVAGRQDHPAFRLGIMVAGQDNNIYVEAIHAPPILVNQFVPNADSIADSEFVMRYSPEDESWSVIQIPFSQLYREGSSTMQPVINALIGVDASGNLYFVKMWNTSDGHMVDIVKVDPQGNQLWRVTEEDLGVTPSNVDLLAEDEIFTFNGFDNGNIVTYSVSVPEATPIP